MTRIYLAQALVEAAEYPVPDDAHRHLVQVMRLGVGDGLVVFDGAGTEAPAILIAVDKRSSRIRVGAPTRPGRESPLDVTLLQGVSKGDRMDYTLQKAVELGVTRIQPLSTQRSMVKLDADRWDKKCERWRSVIISACEQSGRTVVPALLPIVSLQQALLTLSPNTLKLALIPHDGRALRSLAAPSHGVALLVGPEGGLDDAEIKASLMAGFVAVQLGPRVLRTETAGVATLAAMQAMWGDWKD